MHTLVVILHHDLRPNSSRAWILLRHVCASHLIARPTQSRHEQTTRRPILSSAHCRPFVWFAGFTTSNRPRDPGLSPQMASDFFFPYCRSCPSIQTLVCQFPPSTRSIRNNTFICALFVWRERGIDCHNTFEM